MPVYIYRKKWRFGRVTPMPDILTHSQTTEYSATQLVSSIKHKLSHAISNQLLLCRQRILISGMKASDVLMGLMIQINKSADYHYQGTV